MDAPPPTSRLVNGVVVDLAGEMLRFPDGREESHRVIGVLSFGRERLSGERVWASERLLQLMFGPAYEQATAIR